MLTDDESRRELERTLHPDGDTSLVGETIEIRPGILLQRPSTAIMQELAERDDRIKYVAADLTEVYSIFGPPITPDDIFSARVVGPLNARIMADFPSDGDVYTRGVVVSLEDEFLGLPTGKYIPGVGPELTQVDNVFSVLNKGREGSKPNLPNTSLFGGHYGIGTQPDAYLYRYTNNACQFLSETGQARLADNLFPGLLVYPRSTIHDWSRTKPNTRISALYITDRIVPKRT